VFLEPSTVASVKFDIYMHLMLPQFSDSFPQQQPSGETESQSNTLSCITVSSN
jgi:hypothetical protein